MYFENKKLEHKNMFGNKKFTIFGDFCFELNPVTALIQTNNSKKKTSAMLKQKYILNRHMHK